MKKYSKKIYQDFKYIGEYYNFLTHLTSNDYYIGTVNEWLVDNYYLILEREKSIKNFLKNNRDYKIAFSGQKDLYDIMYKILSHNKFKIDVDSLIRELNLYQENYNYYFTYQEIDLIGSVTFLVLLDELVLLSRKEKNKIEQDLKARDILSDIKNYIAKYHDINLNMFIGKDNNLGSEHVFVERLNAGIKQLGHFSSEAFKQLTNILEHANINLNNLIEEVYQDSAINNILVTNIFNSIVKINKIQIEKLYRKVSKTEYVLMMDSYYGQMTKETKEMYRRRIYNISKKKKITEYECAKKLISVSTQEEKHIGFYLQTKPHLKLRSIVYILLILIMTISISVILSTYFIKSRLLGTFLLLIPVSAIVIEILNRIYMRIYSPVPIAKLDFRNGIPKSSSTMTVIVTILKNKEKVRKMFDTLESYYLANKSDNLYFTLLGDCSASNQQEENFDKEIMEYGKARADKLNHKYGKDIFYFVYRKRLYNESEQQYLGYERKRGALIHFNRLLLGKMSKEDQEKYYVGHTLGNFDKKIKYIITLDQDTQLISGSVSGLVGAMAHPLNKPVYNSEHTKIISGYGIMQSKVSVDVESTNKSMFTQIYAGIGGYDVYNKVSPNFYQDVFKEGSFWGKGIYDLAVFDDLLGHKFPENRILSHDLIEGNYIRSGYLSDVEVIDDFPSAFLVDATRRHRWARGDMQIASWIFKLKEPLTLIDRFKIFDNIRRGLLDFSLLMVIVVALLFSVINPAWWLLFVILIILMPIIFYMKDKLRLQKERTLKIKHYQDIIYGFKAVFIRTISLLSSIPYNAKLYLDAFIRALYRLKVSHKHLLAWITADDASKNTNNNFLTYINSFKINYIVSLLLIVLTFLVRREYLLLSFYMSFLFVSSSLIFYLISLNLDNRNNKMTKKELEDIKEVAYDTWQFYNQFLTSENNYLIIDNYQLNRDIKEDVKTSPTNIGFSLMSVISAYELEFITLEEALDKIENIIGIVEKLEKWHGHLYNWYHVKTLEKMYPSTISTVDSGNFIASLIVTKSFVKKYGKENLKNRIENLIGQANFKYLFNKDEMVFSCGYDVYNEKLIQFNYNKFASESRLTSFVAIAKGDIKKDHWFLLDKTLTTYQGRKGLLSWSGTSFEYFMPLIWMKSYPNTLIDESYYFAYYCQKEYMQSINSNMPWGISESAYNLLDDSQNYKYKAFGTPYLKFRDNNNERIVVAPYASILAISEFSRDVYNNMHKFKKLKMYGQYGFYESYDYEDKTPILSYYAHHQGMILCSLTNYLKKNIIQEYFYDDIRIQAFDILNKEKVQMDPMIDLKIVKYKKYDYAKEIMENDIREYSYLSQRPEVSVLSNSRYNLLLNDRGAGVSSFKTIQLNRYRKTTEQEYGNFLYIKDLDSNKVWSNTYYPTNVKPLRYNVVFALDRISYMRVDDNIVTNTEVIVTKKHNAEIRKISFKNVSKKERKLELTTYTEPIICENEADIGHRVFNSMFIKSEYDEDTKSLIFHRRNRNSKDKYYMINRLFIESPLDNYSFETERSNFIDKKTGYYSPFGLDQSLSNYVGDNLDPISSLRNTIVLEPNKEKSVYIVTGFGKSKEQVLEIANEYNSELDMEEAFELATIMVNTLTKKLDLTGFDIHLYNVMLNYLKQTTRINLNEERKKLLSENTLGQDSLWGLGISGDRPIILLEMSDANSISLAQELLKAFEYYKNKCVLIDLVIVNSSDLKTAKMIDKVINDELYRIYKTNSFSNTPGKVILLEKEKINNDLLTLLRSIARLSFNTIYNNSLREQIELLQKENQINNYDNPKSLISLNTNSDEQLLFENGYGGFSKDGKEYHIKNPYTKMPWSNVIANEQFGTVITNNDNGFTYADNSREFKITSWSNDTLTDDKSEGIKINNQEIVWHDAVHGLGYSKFKFKNEDMNIDVTYFVPKKDRVKVALFNITNTSNKELDLDISYWINPVLGVSEEKTIRHIVSNYHELSNFLTLQNKYTMSFKENIVYMSSTEKISHVDKTKIVEKTINFNKTLEYNNTITFAFLLGCEKSLDDITDIVKKYQSVDYIKKSYKETINWWRKKLGVIEVNSPDCSFNFMVNNWYLYQTYASRLLSKAGFYQVGGAFGFRDQLQDAMNICIVDPQSTKKQIINCAMHQFKEGDVLHWWHKENHFGLRSRYKDDYLWLVYATSEYLKITDDKSILNEKISFVEGDLLEHNEAERGMVFTYSEEKASLYDHLQIIMDKLFNEIGNNGLPLMGGGDWNDGMNEVGIKGSGTSVWLGFFAYDVVNRFIDFTLKYKQKDVKKYQEFNNNLKEALRKNAWDGHYYLRAFFDNGAKLGSSENKECQIDLISQSWAIMTDIALKKQIKSIIKSVDNKLVDKKYGFIKLLTPAFSGQETNPGYIRDYSVGLRENGGQYTHATIWWIMALIKLGMFDKAYEYYQMINPINHTLTKKDVDRYQVEPYVIAADIYSNPNFIGHGGWTWYTGSSGWFYKVAITSIIGLRKIGHKLYLRPAIPSKWERCEVTYKYQDTIYKININNNQDNNEIIFDGKKVVEINLLNDKKEHVISVNCERRSK